MKEKIYQTQEEYDFNMRKRAQRMSIILTALSREMTSLEKTKYQIPGYLDQRQMRNALSREYISQAQENDERFIEIAHRILNWATDNLPK